MSTEINKKSRRNIYQFVLIVKILLNSIHIKGRDKNNDKEDCNLAAERSSSYLEAIEKVRTL